jgi:hypothetical protein
LLITDKREGGIKRGEELYTKIAWENRFVLFLSNYCIQNWLTTKKAHHTNMTGTGIVVQQKLLDSRELAVVA